MASYVTLTLDTTAPAGGAVSINSGDVATVSRDVSVAITSTDPDLTGYQVKIYGDVDDAFATGSYRAVEGNAPWITLSSPHSVRLSTGDGTKTVRVKIRDTVNNTTSELTDTISLDTAAPVVTIGSGPTPARISKQTGKDSSDLSFSTDTAVTAWKVKAVSSTGAAHSTGTQIPTTAGSSNVTGGALGAATPQTVTIKGTDLETAGAEGDNIIKVFAQDAAGNWSV